MKTLKTLKEDATYRSLLAARNAADEKLKGQGQYATRDALGAWTRANDCLSAYVKQFNAARALLLSK